MVAWQELLNEANAAGSKYDVIRKRHLRALSRYTKRNTIIYYSGWLQKPILQQDAAIPLGISDADKNGFMSAIHKMDRAKGLDLLLHTPGGDMAATESLIDYLRLMFGSNVRAMIPQIAMSGGTIMALSCKEIIMGKESSLGPIDPQYGGIAANALLAEFERIRSEIKADASNALLWQPVLSKIRPGFITECENALEWAQSMAKRLLTDCMFAGERGARTKINKIISHLTENSNTKHHGRHIGLEEAKSIFGHHIVELETDPKLQDLVLSVHHAAALTMQATPAIKLIENDQGRAYMTMIQMGPAPANH